jgi:ATP-dependent RNA helicase RhlE
MTFQDLNLIEPLLKALGQAGYTTPTPIQAAAIPPLLEGRDLLGCAQTGTGKTAAFALPILQRLDADRQRTVPRRPRVLVLTPTRELALQIYESFRTYGKELRLWHAVIYGGVGQTPQVQAMAKGVDVLVATPGRLLDLINQRHVDLAGLEIFVLDEADRMLDMGFIHDVKKIVAMLPARRQNLFFSATMPGEIKTLSDKLLTNPVRVEVTPVSSTAERIDQYVMFVEPEKKRELLRHVLKSPACSRVIVFTRTKHGANKVSDVLKENGVTSAAIHGNKSQTARQAALDGFKSGKIRVLVATDIAARGIDVDSITHVINFELPNVAEDYVHRIGRTARAGAEGIAISFCDAEERAYLRDIERLTGKKVTVDDDHPYHSTAVASGPILSKGKAKAAIEGRRDPRGPRPPARGGQKSRRPGRPGTDNRGGRPPGRSSR